MILTLPPIQLPATGEFERNLSFLLSFLYHRHRGPRYAIRTVLYPYTCTAHMYVCSNRTSLHCHFLQGQALYSNVSVTVIVLIRQQSCYDGGN